MKNLAESLFDDNIKKELPIETLVSSMTYNNTKGMSRTDAADHINAIVNNATEYSLDKLKKSRIDLSKYILIVQWTKRGEPTYPYDVEFYFKRDKNVVMSRLLPSIHGYYWDWCQNQGDYESIKNNWDDYINQIEANNHFSDGDVKFFVLGKSVSKKLINSILERQ